MIPRRLWELLEEELGTGFREDRSLARAVRELSHSFTGDRAKLRAGYLANPRVRAAYLGYFLPLNFAKVLLLLRAHLPGWLPPARPRRAFRILDFGCGPATASLAALEAIRCACGRGDLPEIHLDLVDSQEDALRAAERLVRSYAGKAGLTASIRAFRPDRAAPERAEPPYDLVLAVNVLNELKPEAGASPREPLLGAWDLAAGAMLIVEPGHRVASQRLLRLRERIRKEAGAAFRVLGPCTHAQRCPLHRSKHWCHFSEPCEDQALRALNLRLFQDPRKWLKFSYLFLSRESGFSEWDGRTYRAIGDLHPTGGARGLAIDLCMPESKLPLELQRGVPPEVRGNLVRGAVVRVESGPSASLPAVLASPLSARSRL